jgi:hypothetical protein
VPGSAGTKAAPEMKLGSPRYNGRPLPMQQRGTPRPAIAGLGARFRIAVVTTLVMLLASCQVGPVGAPSGAATDVAKLIAATTPKDIEAQIAVIFGHAGIASVRGGKPVAQVDGSGPGSVAAWLINFLAQEHLHGTNLSMSDLAAVFDFAYRARGGPNWTAMDLADLLGTWVRSTDLGPQERYAADVLEEFGKATDPAYDLRSGTAVTARLPYFGVIMISILASAGVMPPPRPSASPTAASAGLRTLSIVNSACDAVEKPFEGVRVINKILKLFVEKEGPLPFLDPEATPAANKAMILEFVTESLKYLAMRNFWGITVQQLAPDPVHKQHKDDPNPTYANVVVTVKSTMDWPEELIACARALGVDLPKENETKAGQVVRWNPGDGFVHHLWSTGKRGMSGYDFAGTGGGGGFGNNTDASGQVHWDFMTHYEKADPPGTGSIETDSAFINVQVELQDLKFDQFISAPDAFVKALDSIFPKNVDFPIGVEFHEPKGKTLNGTWVLFTFSIAVKIEIQAHSCTGYEGPWTGTVFVSGGFTPQVAPAIKQLFPGAQTDAQGNIIVNFGVQTWWVDNHTRLVPIPNFDNSVGAGQIGLSFTAEDSGLITLGGQAISDPITRNQGTFYVKDGAPECG